MSDQFSILTGELERPAFVNGSTPRTRRASETGAIAAQQDRPTKLARVRKAWRQPHTLQDVAAIANLPVSSVCSLKACLADELVEVDAVVKFWPDGRTTHRTRWQIVPKAAR